MDGANAERVAQWNTSTRKIMNDRPEEPLDDPYGWRAHDKGTTHSGKHGHYCADWDGLWICEDCDEFKLKTLVVP